MHLLRWTRNRNHLYWTLHNKCCQSRFESLKVGWKILMSWGKLIWPMIWRIQWRMKQHQNRLKLIFDILSSLRISIYCQSKAPRRFHHNIYQRFESHHHKFWVHQQMVNIKPLQLPHPHNPKNSRNVEW